MLKTAGGYLLVLHTFESSSSSGSEQCVRLLQRAKEAGDWDLCKELARFLMALDESGEELRKAVERMGIRPILASAASSSASVSSASSAVASGDNSNDNTPRKENLVRLKNPRPNGRPGTLDDVAEHDESASSNGSASGSPERGEERGTKAGSMENEDYFSSRRGLR